MNHSFDLTGKVAIVTGASSGMGYAISLRYAAAGAIVIATARREALLKQLAAEAKDSPGQIIPFVGEITNDSIIKKMINFALKQAGRLDIVVANAGIMDNFAPVEDVTDHMWQQVMDVNLNAPFKLIRAALPKLAKNKKTGGSVIIVASVGGLRGGPAGVTYVSSKHGAIGLMRAVAYTSADKNIRCNAICPGAVSTDINNSMSKLYPEGPHKAGMEKSMKGMHLVPKMGTPEEIAAIAHFLASDASSLISGAAITADGGWSTY